MDYEEKPTALQLAELLAHPQLPELKDRLIADIPGLHLPMGLLLFGESVTRREDEARAGTLQRKFVHMPGL